MKEMIEEMKMTKISYFYFMKYIVVFTRSETFKPSIDLVEYSAGNRQKNHPRKSLYGNFYNAAQGR